MVFNALDLNWCLFLLRLIVGVVFIYHGIPKVNKTQAMAAGMGMNPGLVRVLGLVEILSGAACIFGVYTEVAALALVVVMAGATYKKVFTWGISFSAPDKLGWEFDATLLAAALVIAASGGGTIQLFF